MEQAAVTEDAGVIVRARRLAARAWTLRLALCVSLLIHVILLILFQLGLDQPEPIDYGDEGIPVELVKLVQMTPPQEEAEEVILPTEVEEEEDEPQEPLYLDLRNAPQPGPNIDGFRRFVRALDCTPDMAASSPEMLDACNRVSIIMSRQREANIRRIKERQLRIAIANGWALTPSQQRLMQDVIREEGEQGAPGADSFGPWPWDAKP